MKPILSREQVRKIDQHAVEVCKVPSIVLMENAGRGAADVIEGLLATKPGRVVVIAGAGNNGGDGFVVARRLSVRGHAVRVLLAATREKLKGDALVNHDAWVGVGGSIGYVVEGDLAMIRAEIEAASVVVDALLGTGLDREVKGFFATLIQAMDVAHDRLVALDVPSGMDANTGQAQGPELRARDTVTFAFGKLGLETSSGAERAGRVTVVDIGVPDSLHVAVGASAELLEPSDVAAWLRPRGVATHKGSAGRVVCVAGSAGKTGAALLVARGALRSGAGLVTIATFPDAADAIDRRVLEEMTARIDPAHVEESLAKLLDGASAVVIGPGLGHDEAARKAVDHVALRHDGPVVIDADGLTHLAGRLAELRGAKGRLVLTPHPGEMARLLGITTREVEADRFGAVTRAVETSGATVLLKGARTLIGSPGALTVVNPSGTPAMATAGAGDVLSGVLGAHFAALGDPRRAASVAAYLHGLSGEQWVKRHGADRGLLAHELADGIPGAVAALTGGLGSLPV
ncbi:MAG TPA: NAD(P)H-hydrate dehydratase [Polyangiaceae bacterium]|jgi:NAD(P)H-hydrate epimerase|nr:NAD(P)H-hydrate dehydratase [Polyangiaceae bacterium]